LACAVAMSSACRAAATDVDKKKLADDIQKHYKPGSGSKSSMSTTTKSASPMSSANSCTQSTGQIAACSAACAGSCIFQCSPVPGGNFPWSNTCHTCVNACMDKCTGCGTGKLD
jgi:hypothetical protein